MITKGPKQQLLIQYPKTHPNNFKCQDSPQDTTKENSKINLPPNIRQLRSYDSLLFQKIRKNSQRSINYHFITYKNNPKILPFNAQNKPQISLNNFDDQLKLFTQTNQQKIQSQKQHMNNKKNSDYFQKQQLNIPPLNLNKFQKLSNSYGSDQSITNNLALRIKHPHHHKDNITMQKQFKPSPLQIQTSRQYFCSPKYKLNQITGIQKQINKFKHPSSQTLKKQQKGQKIKNIQKQLTSINIIPYKTRYNSPQQKNIFDKNKQIIQEKKFGSFSNSQKNSQGQQSKYKRIFNIVKQDKNYQKQKINTPIMKSINSQTQLRKYHKYYGFEKLQLYDVYQLKNTKQTISDNQNKSKWSPVKLNQQLNHKQSSSPFYKNYRRIKSDAQLKFFKLQKSPKANSLKNLKFQKLPNKLLTCLIIKQLSLVQNQIYHKFQIINVISENIKRSIYIVIHQQSQTLYCLKKIHKNSTPVDSLINQNKIQLFINHPNTVKSYGTFYDRTYLYILNQYMEDGTLSTRKKIYSLIADNITKQQYNERNLKIKNIISQLLNGLVYLHSNNITHKDIKYDNIFISNNIYKIGDYGSSTYSCSQEHFGTLDYAAPQIIQKGKIDSSVDLWSLGCVTYELSIGMTPFYHQDQKQTLRRINEVQYNKSLIPDVDLRDFIDSLLRKNSKERLSAQKALDHNYLKSSKQSSKYL